MSSRRAVLVAIVAVALAGCTAGSATRPTAIAQVTQPPLTSSPVVTPEPPTGPPTPVPTQKPTAKPTAKPKPAPPPKPTGVKFVGDDAVCLQEVEESCVRYKMTQTVLWKAPRTKGVEIRVFGVTECLARPAHPKPGASGPCLVKGTDLPPSIRTLLAKAPASAGWVSWSWTEEDEGCNPSEPVWASPPTGRRTTRSSCRPSTRRTARALPSPTPGGGSSPRKATWSAEADAVTSDQSGGLGPAGWSGAPRAAGGGDDGGERRLPRACPGLGRIQP